MFYGDNRNRKIHRFFELFFNIFYRISQRRSSIRKVKLEFVAGNNDNTYLNFSILYTVSKMNNIPD